MRTSLRTWSRLRLGTLVPDGVRLWQVTSMPLTRLCERASHSLPACGGPCNLCKPGYDIELQLFNKLWPKLDPSQRRLHDFLMDVSWTLEEGLRGVYMLEDLEQLERHGGLEGALNLIEEKTGVRVNRNSPQQVASLLFDTLKLPVVDITRYRCTVYRTAHAKGYCGKGTGSD